MTDGDYNSIPVGYSSRTVWSFDNSPLPGQVLRHVYFDANYEQGSIRRPASWISDPNPPNCISSQVMKGEEPNKWEAAQDRHKVVIDIDMPCKVVPSSTPGHFHLYIDHEMTWEEYLHFLDGCLLAGIIEPGYHRASKYRGFTDVRLPWIKKDDPEGSYIDP